MKTLNFGGEKHQLQTPEEIKTEKLCEYVACLQCTILNLNDKIAELELQIDQLTKRFNTSEK